MRFAPKGHCLMRRSVVFLASSSVVLIFDLWTKWYVFRWLGGPRENPVFWIWEGLFGFQTTLNEGAVFGIGQGWTFVFALAGVIALGGFLCWFFFFAPKEDLWLALAMGAMIGGILGNLYDRLGLHGLRWKYPWILGTDNLPGEPVYAVRDFILVMIGPYPWPNFNLADSALVCGVGLMVWRLWLWERQPPAQEAEVCPSGQVDRAARRERPSRLVTSGSDQQRRVECS